MLKQTQGRGGHYYGMDSAWQSGIGVDSRTKNKWKHVELGFAVLCWELLGSFSSTAFSEQPAPARP